jgi:hypothetical protein
MQKKNQLLFTIKIKKMVIDRKLTIQELLFNKPVEINKSLQLGVGGVTADNIVNCSPVNTLDLDAAQFHDGPNFYEEIGKHFGKYWGWYAGAAAIGIVAYYSTRPKEKETKSNGFKSNNGLIPYPDSLPIVPININIQPNASIRNYIDDAKSKQINAH